MDHGRCASVYPHGPWFNLDVVGAARTVLMRSRMFSKKYRSCPSTCCRTQASAIIATVGAREGRDRHPLIAAWNGSDRRSGFV